LAFSVVWPDTEMASGEAKSKHRSGGERYNMNDDAAAQQVRIHINRQAYHSPNPTTGEALYALGDIPKNEALYREVQGDEEDERTVRDDTPVNLVADAHFYSKRVFDILVNGDDHVIDTDHINYDRVVNLYLGSGGAPSAEYLVKYSHGPAKNPSGTLVQGPNVEVKDEMRFRVAGTGES
jgi:hypothetical protein